MHRAAQTDRGGDSPSGSYDGPSQPDARSLSITSSCTRLKLCSSSMATAIGRGASGAAPHAATEAIVRPAANLYLTRSLWCSLDITPAEVIFRHTVQWSGKRLQHSLQTRFGESAGSGEGRGGARGTCYGLGHLRRISRCARKGSDGRSGAEIGIRTISYPLRTLSLSRITTRAPAHNGAARMLSMRRAHLCCAVRTYASQILPSMRAVRHSRCAFRSCVGWSSAPLAGE